jgi:hypothetical protein
MLREGGVDDGAAGGEALPDRDVEILDDSAVERPRSTADASARVSPAMEQFVRPNLISVPLRDFDPRVKIFGFQPLQSCLTCRVSPVFRRCSGSVAPVDNAAKSKYGRN